MRQKLATGSIILLVGLALLSACRPGGGELQISTDLEELNLAGLWNRVAEATDVQVETARLSSLRLSVASDGTLEGLHVVFHGLNEQGSNAAYFVDMSMAGNLELREQPWEPVDYPAQPADVMDALEDAGLADVAAERGGITLWADSISGDISYRNENLDLYLLEDGQRQPLEEIVFHSDSPWMTITVCPQTPEDEETEATETDSGLVVTETAALGESDCEIWFLEQAAAKADEVEFVKD